jgi:hypothetical protein
LIPRDIGSILIVTLLMSCVAFAQGSSGYDGSFMGFNASGDYLSSGFPWEDFGSMDSSGFDFSSAYSHYSEYYYKSSVSMSSGIISTPIKFEVTKKVPTSILVGGQAVPYTQYASSLAQVQPSQLWIQGSTDWTQYVICPAGTWIQLVANAPWAGQADFYEINQTTPGQVATSYRQYQFYQGYNSMSFNAASVGRHVLFFVMGNLPSSSVIVDVVPAQVFQQTVPQVTGAGAVPRSASGVQSYPSVLSGSVQSATTQPYAQSYSQGGAQFPQGTVVQGTSLQPAPTSGDTPVTIQSRGMRGYQVFLDGVYIGTEGIGGDPQSGKFSFLVQGGTTHEIRVFDGQFNYPKTMYFDRGVMKVINVEPGTTVYV